MHTTYPMVGKRASDPNPVPKYGRMFLHVGAAAIMVKGFTSLSQLAVGKVMQPQVSYNSVSRWIRANDAVRRYVANIDRDAIY
jgi:hypothetical protein